MERKQEVSKAVIQRLPRYYRNICELKAEGEQRISSKALAERMGLTASQIRQDFNCFGGFGQQGYGYNIDKLQEELGAIMGLRTGRTAILLGAGNLGRALLNNFNFSASGFDDIFCAPHSRHTEVRAADIRKDERLTILAESHEAGVHIVEAMNGRQIFVLGHGEYDADTLKKEYERDLAKGMNPEVPRHYFRNDDPNEDVLVTWKAHANLFYTNWVNYYVYQTTPYYLDKM